MSKSTGSRFGWILFWATVLVGLPAAALALYWLAIAPRCVLPAKHHPTETVLMEARRAQAKDKAIHCTSNLPGCRYREFALALQRAVVAAGRCVVFAHEGSDWEGIWDAALYNLEVGEFKRGGSTITQQLAKISTCRPNGLLITKARGRR